MNDQSHLDFFVLTSGRVESWLHGISALPPNPSSIMAMAIVVIMTIDIIASRGVQRYQELAKPKMKNPSQMY